MNHRRLVRSFTISAVTVLSLAACGSSDDDAVDNEISSAPTTTIDLADGAFERNDSAIIGADGTPATAAVEDADAADDGSTTAPADTAAVDQGAADGTTDDAGTDTDGATPDEGGDQPATDSTDGSTGDGGPGGADAGTDDDDADDVGVAADGTGTGTIVIGAVTYPFTSDFCAIIDTAAEIVGEGTSSDGNLFEASIFYSSVDLDGDGAPDDVLDISVDPVPPAGAADDSVPSFFVTKVDSPGVESGEDVAFTVTGNTISGTGTILDFNGVAFPDDEPAPMTFEATCA